MEHKKLKDSCSLIVLNDNHWAHILMVRRYDDAFHLPTAYVKENESIVDCALRLANSLGITFPQPHLDYVVEDNENRNYIFIGETNIDVESGDLVWILGNTLSEQNDIIDNKVLIDELTLRFQRGLAIVGVKTIKENYEKA